MGDTDVGISHTGSGPRPRLKKLPREVPMEGENLLCVNRKFAVQCSHFGLSDGADHVLWPEASLCSSAFTTCCAWWVIVVMCLTRSI